MGKHQRCLWETFTVLLYPFLSLSKTVLVLFFQADSLKEFEIWKSTLERLVENKRFDDETAEMKGKKILIFFCLFCILIFFYSNPHLQIFICVVSWQNKVISWLRSSRLFIGSGTVYRVYYS